MNTIIIYSSKTGFTKKYAQWMKEDLGCDCVPYEERGTVDLDKYQAVAFGSGTYIGKINKLGWLKKQLPQLRGKKIAVFFTGAMAPDASDVRRLERENFTPQELERIKPFYLQGGLNYAAMGIIDRFLMAGFRKMLKSHADSSKERVMLQNVQQSFDKTDRESLKAVEEYLKQ